MQNSPQGCSWSVFYTDGSSLEQYAADGTEIPMRNIEWDRASRLLLESQLAKSTFEVRQPAPGLVTSLRRRVFRTMNAKRTTWLGPAVHVMMIVVSAEGAEVDDASVRHVTYWLPDGTVHDCHLFSCPDVANFITQSQPLMPHTAATQSQVDAHLA